MPVERIRESGRDVARQRPASNRDDRPARIGIHRRSETTSERRAEASDAGQSCRNARPHRLLVRRADMKTQHAAVVVIPKQDIWDPIQSIRLRYDRNVQRSMPHVTLLYPFRPRAMFDDVEPALRRACAALTPFRTTLENLRFFSHGRDRFTIWLAPEPSASFVRLQA